MAVRIDMDMPKRKVPRLYQIWVNMRRRCREKNRKHYFQKGIKVCKEWNDFNIFSKWAYSNGYKDTLTIDRIDFNGNYEPSNCRWITNAEQQRNRSDIHYLSFNGETHCISEWAEITGIDKWTISKRLLDGWSVERALTEKTHKRTILRKGKLLFNINGRTLDTNQVAKLVGKSRATICWIVRKFGKEIALEKIRQYPALKECE